MSCPNCRNTKFKSVPRPSISAGERYKCLHCGVIIELKIIEWIGRKK